MPIQIDLVEYPPRRQRVDADLARVATTIAQSIVRFCSEHIGREWHADDLRRHVASECPTAPGSADRVLRSLRKQGVLTYRVVSRSRSLYLCTEVIQR